MTVKVSRIQHRVYEIGLVGRIAHNLARYMAGHGEEDMAENFLFSVRLFMAERRVPKEDIARYLRLAALQAQDEVDFFARHGVYSDSAGGTSITVEVLIGNILDDLGFTA